MAHNDIPAFLEQLNPEQRKAVLHTNGPAIIIAGAGSGKTRVLTYRIAYLLQQGVDAFNILSLTFTNKAAREMRDRIERMVGSEARNLWMGTFHAVFARILRVEADKLNYPSNFSIYDTDDSKSLIRSIVKELQLDDKQYRPGTVLGRISGAKNKLISWKEYQENDYYFEEDSAANRPMIGKIYKTYAQRCFAAGAMDFDDLLFNTNVLFNTHPDVLNKYQHKFKYVMVDEYQDTNVSQYLITRMLASVHRNIAVVGDDAQSIYAFRGANINNILNFKKDYPEAEEFRLEQNYRSTKTIVKVANEVIKFNKRQLRKEVWTDNEQGTKIKLIKCPTDNEEGKQIAQQIFELKMAQNFRNSDIAVLYRTNSQSRAIEEALRRQNISYRIIGGLSFYQRKEIKDLVAYLRFTLNQEDEEAFKRIINLPKRGIGAASVSKLIVAARDNEISLWEAVKNADRILSSRIANAVDNFYHQVESFKIALKHKDAYDIAQQIAKESGLLAELYEDKTIEGVSRYENVTELLGAIKEFTEDKEREDHSLGAFLQEIALLTDADNEDKNQDSVKLMTIHMSKGLEFKTVCIAGLEENLFPSQMMMESREDLEEERRLFYVAITRAEQFLILTYAKTRYRFGKLIECEPSRFLNEVNMDYVELVFQEPKGIDFSDTLPNKGGRGLAAQLTQKPQQKTVVHKPSTNFSPSPLDELEEGIKVEHQKFGFGKIKQLDRANGKPKAIVSFEQAGEKTLLLQYAKLMKVD